MFSVSKPANSNYVKFAFITTIHSYQLHMYNRWQANNSLLNRGYICTFMISLRTRNASLVTTAHCILSQINRHSSCGRHVITLHCIKIIILKRKHNSRVKKFQDHARSGTYFAQTTNFRTDEILVLGLQTTKQRQRQNLICSR